MILESLVESATLLGHIVLVWGFSYLIAGLVGVELFGGQLRGRYDSECPCPCWQRTTERVFVHCSVEVGVDAWTISPDLIAVDGDRGTAVSARRMEPLSSRSRFAIRIPGASRPVMWMPSAMYACALPFTVGPVVFALRLRALEPWRWMAVETNPALSADPWSLGL